jgi:hypothetical protein
LRGAHVTLLSLLSCARGDLVEPLVKHALMSVLKTKGRKSEERVQHWHLSQRMLVVYAAHFNGMSPEELIKKQEVGLVGYFWVSLIRLRAVCNSGSSGRLHACGHRGHRWQTLILADKAGVA